MNNNNGLRIGRFLIALGGVIGLIPILMSMKPYSFVYTLIILGLLIGGYFVWFNVKTYKQKEKEEESK